LASKPQQIHSVLCTAGFKGPHLEILQQHFAPAPVLSIPKKATDEIADALQDVDVAVVSGKIDQRFLNAPRLSWVHCDKAGLELSATPQLFASNLIVTGSAGRSAPALAEHALYFMLSLTYRAPRFLQAQKQRDWGFPGYKNLQAMHGSTVGILGLGHTGMALAEKARAMGLRVLAWRKTDREKPDCVDEVFSAKRGEGIQMLLEESDYVVLCLRLSNATSRILGEAEFSQMKNTAFVINIGRGDLIDEQALINAVNQQKIAGAGLDTFRVEPLPSSSPLWRTPNVLITPHFTPLLRDRTDRVLDIIGENIKRYRAGLSMLNQLTEDDIYTPPRGKKSPAGLGEKMVSWFK
jgi:phosphoglycerate dehydrogenase-like enzyme